MFSARAGEPKLTDHNNKMNSCATFMLSCREGEIETVKFR